MTQPVPRALALAPSVLLAIAACGGGPEPADGEGTTPARTGMNSTPPHDHVEHPGPPTPWADMSWDDRRRYMGREVLPVMAEEFALYDAERYADFTCETCHGADAEARRYDMPNPSLLMLHPTGSDEQHQVVRDHPRMTRFMFNHVVWNVQRLLGAQTFDPATQTGFSCATCHPTAGADEAPAPDAGPTAAPPAATP